MPWYSSFGSDFNYDWGVSLDESVTPVVYNYRTKAEHEARSGEPGSFDDSRSRARASAASSTSTGASSTPTRTFARGLESTGGSYYFLDLTALGRQEDWEEPKGRTDSARSNRPDFAS